MDLNDFDYYLPPEMIAQRPADRRELSRMLVLDRLEGTVAHRSFTDILHYLQPTDTLVINDTRVLPWKVTGRRATGGKIEGLLIECRDDGTMSAVFKSHGKLLPGEKLRLLDRRLTAHLICKDESGEWTIRFDEPDAQDILDEYGLAPLPPYIKRTRDDASLDGIDRERYQTVFATRPGAIAAPTAGLHFTDELLHAITHMGVAIARVTLHVGRGTFQPVKTERIEEHRMHSEYYEMSSEVAELINSRRDGGGRTVAVGTTSVRVLETCSDDTGVLNPGAGRTEIFIYPPYEFRAVDALLTNFHLPRSTLLMLVSAFAGREKILAAYEEAKREGYRFFSYGDAMLIV